ncbi:MAG: hypothetical protein KDA64_10560 [Rhodospirillaceae bacterium]|nr:hypothetical protein [Rhodospirillaceae bacterium]
MRLSGITCCAALAALSVWAGISSTAQAAEAILFAGNNCSGQYRMLDRSVSDFNAIGFDNEVNSLMVITGTFRFYRDANYGEGNGPSFQLGPSGQVDTCWSLDQASQGQFPNDRMSAAQLINDTVGPQPTGVAIVYDNPGFGGQYRILTRNVSDFNAIGFDNDVESIRVVSGSWTFFRNANYDAPPDRPSITLGPGDYANVANVPGYPPGTFPGDLMSSASVQAGGAPPPPPPPPPPVQCAPGQAQGNTACHNCWDHFGNEPGSSYPDASGSTCQCAPGYEWVGFGAANIDGVTFRHCLAVSEPPPPPPPPTPNCPGPYQYLDPATNACAFRCHQSTQPNLQTGQCDCLPGTAEAGVLADGRRYCLGTGGGTPPTRQTRVTVPGGQLFPQAQGNGFTMTAVADQGSGLCQVQGDQVVFVLAINPSSTPQTCTATLLGGRALAPGWRFEDYRMNVQQGQAVPTGLTGQLPFQVRLIIPPFQTQASVRIISVDLIGPAGQGWPSALQ